MPVCMSAGAHEKQYAWDGRRLLAVEPGGAWLLQDPPQRGGGAQPAASARTLQSRCSRAMHDMRAAFFPNPAEVSPGGVSEGARRSAAAAAAAAAASHLIPSWFLHAVLTAVPLGHRRCPCADYWQYCRWRAWHRLFSSMGSIFATQVGALCSVLLLHTLCCSDPAAVLPEMPFSAMRGP